MRKPVYIWAIGNDTEIALPRQREPKQFFALSPRSVERYEYQSGYQIARLLKTIFAITLHWLRLSVAKQSVMREFSRCAGTLLAQFPWTASEVARQITRHINGWIVNGRQS
jgi:hypothetical protein